MGIERFIGIGTARGQDVFDYVLQVLESEKPSVIALDENPISMSTLIQMRCSKELFTEAFVMKQKQFLLKRDLEVGNCAGILYAIRYKNIPLHFVDGSFREPLSETGEEIGIYPYTSNMDFAATVDLMRIPIKLIKGRYPTYPGWDFDYELIHAYQTDEHFHQMDRAIWQRNQFTGRVLERMIESADKGILAFIGNRKRFSLDLYKDTEGITDEELAEYKPLGDYIPIKDKVFYDAITRIRNEI